jgi:hypothetical protein
VKKIRANKTSVGQFYGYQAQLLRCLRTCVDGVEGQISPLDCDSLYIVNHLSKEHTAFNFNSAYGSILVFQDGSAPRTRPRSVLNLKTLMYLLSLTVNLPTGVRVSFILFVVYVHPVS